MAVEISFELEILKTGQGHDKAPEKDQYHTDNAECTQWFADVENQWFFDLLETFSASTKDTPLRELVLQTYTFAQGNPRPEALLDRIAEDFHLQEGETVDDCVWFSFIRQGAESSVEFALHQLRRAYALADEVEFAGYHKLLKNEVSALEHLQAALTEPYAEWRLAYLSVDFARLPSYRGQEKELAERMAEIVAQVTQIVKDVLNLS